MVAGLKAPLAATLVLVLFGGLGAGLAEVSETDFPSDSVRTDSIPRLPLLSPSSAYWESLQRQIRELSDESLFPAGIPTNADFRVWLESETNRLVRGYGVTSVIATDGIHSIPFLSWMERAHPGWQAERELAFSWISATSPFWATNRPPKWSREEASVFSDFFRRRFETETNWLCRMRIDEFLVRTQPGWKPSDERLVFLQRSLDLARTESSSNSFLRRIESRLDPIDVEAYERRMGRVWH